MIDQFQSHGYLAIKGIEYSIHDDVLVYRKEIHKDPAWTEVDWSKVEYIEDDPVCEFAQLQAVIQVLTGE